MDVVVTVSGSHDRPSAASHGSQRFWRSRVLTIAALTCYALAMILSGAESNRLAWGAFGLWIAAVGLLLWSARPLGFLRVSRIDAAAVAGCVVVCVVARSVFLDIYPFHLAGDAIRDGGLYPTAIGDGRLRPWGWGPYQGMTLVLPATIAAFYRMFGGVHFFQLCSIVFAAAEMVLLYALVRRAIGRKEAVVACAVLAFLPGHLAFTRTETTILFNSFWTTVLLAAGYRYAQSQDRRALVAFGLLGGVAANFHSAVRAVVFIAAAWVALRETWRVLSLPSTSAIGDGVLRLTLWLVAGLIGVGPSLRFIDMSIFGGHRLEIGRGLEEAMVTYLQTLLALCYLPLPASNVPFSEPLVTPLMGIPLLLGVAVAFTTTKPLSRLVLGLLLILPMTNSAVTDLPMQAYRLAPLFPVVAIAIGSASQLWPSSRWFGLAMTVIALAGSAFHVTAFFWRAPMAAIQSGGMTREMAYAYAHAVRVIRSAPTLSSAPELCWRVSVRQQDALQLLHYQENLRFYVPHAAHHFSAVPGLADTVMYISRSCAGSIEQTHWTQVLACTASDIYRCGGTGPISVFIQDD